MASTSLVSIASAYGLPPDDSNPLPEPMLTNYQWGRVAFTWVQFHWKSCSRYLSLMWFWNLIIKTHWCRATHICVGKLTIIGSDNGLSPGRRQAIIWTNAGILLIGPIGTNFNEILIGIQTFSFTKMYLKISSGKWRPFCLGLNELKPVTSGTICIACQCPMI